MSSFLPYTGATIRNILGKATNPFKQDIQDGTYTTSNRYALVAGVPRRFKLDGTLRNVIQNPAYMTNSYDGVTDTFKATTEMDSPFYGGDLSWKWDPTSANPCDIVIRIWINDAVPKLIKSYHQTAVSTLETYNQPITWYWGTETGYDAKNDGIYFEIESSIGGEVYDMAASFFSVQ